MTIRRDLFGAMLAAAALGIAAGCGGSGGGAAGDASAGAPSGGSGGAGTPVNDGGLSIEEVTTLTLEGDLNVRGWVVDVDGKTRLCSSAEGAPPVCGKPSLVLVGYEGEIPSTEEVTVTGAVLGTELTVG